jgi:mercuric ion binding protein
MRFIQTAFAFLFFLMLASFSNAQTSGMVKKNAKAITTEQAAIFKVLGNCDMCQKNIQTASASAGSKKADWNKDTDMLTVTFDPARTSVDAIQKAIAKAGYDNAGYKADDEAYNKLHTCCQYDRTGAAGGTKSCSGEN